MRISDWSSDVCSSDLKVITGPNARAVLVRGEEYAIVAPNTRLEIADPAKSGGLWQIVESAGNIVFSIKKKLTQHFGVQTPYLAAVVKGTTFSVRSEEHTSELKPLMRSSYAVFCLKKQNKHTKQ